MGISVANSAITTLFAAALLFACGFYFFFQRRGQKLPVGLGIAAVTDRGVGGKPLPCVSEVAIIDLGRWLKM